jgi:hypothetical protein
MQTAISRGAEMTTRWIRLRGTTSELSQGSVATGEELSGSEHLLG